MQLSRGAQRCFEVIQSLARLKGYSFASQQAIADMAQCSLRSAKAHIKALVDGGYIQATKRYHACSLYRVVKVQKTCTLTCTLTRRSYRGVTAGTRNTKHATLRSEIWPEPKPMQVENRMIPGKEREMAQFLAWREGLRRERSMSGVQ